MEVGEMSEGNGADKRKLWRGNKNKVKLEISIYSRINVIHIGKDVLRVIGAPSHICLKINKEMDSFVVMPCEPAEPMAFKVPDGIMLNPRKQMKVTSQSFVIGLLSVNELEFGHTYKIPGIYSESNNAVVFNITSVIQYRKNFAQDKCFYARRKIEL